MPTTHTINILPHGQKIESAHGKSLISALVDHSIFLRSDCGGRGICGKCKVHLINADGTKEPANSCTFEITTDLTIEIPGNSMHSSHVISKAPATFPPSFQQQLATRIRKDKKHGIAVDLGTTTIAVYLCDIQKGDIIASIAVKNPQSLYGDDVMSRIGAIDMGQDNLTHLRSIVVKAIEWGARALLEKSELKQEEITKIVAVGNPTMIHILMGVDPSPIGTYPYQPVFYEAKTILAADAGFCFGNASLQTLPQVSGFIGGDILSAAIDVDMEHQPDGTLLIDLGTNGELLLKSNKGFYATSCATGPAFEGATLACGMQAIPGAINKISIIRDDEYPNHTIIKPNNSLQVKANGICGTGVISGIAELKRKRIIETGGAFRKGNDLKPLVRDEEGKLRYILVPHEATADGSSIYISQKDVRSVQLGKAALITGIEFLLKAAGYEHPEKIIIAGAFGTYIEIEDMFTLGMIPAMEAGTVEISGNSAGAGAVMVLCDNEYLQKAIGMANRITTVDLASDLRFQEVFVDRLSFPIEKN